MPKRFTAFLLIAAALALASLTSTAAPARSEYRLQAAIAG
jgi:hypothetical protein